MDISLTSEQETFIGNKLKAGKYRNVEEILEVALKLLDEYDRSYAEWKKDVKNKIDEAIATSEHTPPIEGEKFINEIVARFRKS